jgi:hypothetical protein
VLLQHQLHPLVQPMTRRGMASRFRRASDWSPPAAARLCRELSELLLSELTSCFSELACFLSFLFSSSFFPHVSLEKKSLEYFLSLFVIISFPARIVISRGGPVGLPQRIGYSGTSARRSRLRSSVETIWQGKSQGAVM